MTVTCRTSARLSIRRDAGVRGAGRGALICLTGAVMGCAAVGPVQTSTSAAGTVAGAVDYRSIEREVLAELNAARTNPAGYAAHLSALLASYQGNVLQRPGRVAIRTQEGPAAVREAIAALQRQPPLGALTPSVAMSNAARDLVVDQGTTGGVGHIGRDNSSPTTRLARYGTWGVSSAENIDYGLFASGREVVIDLLVDDGVGDRGHRRNIFDPTARIAGIACGPHPRYGSVCVIDQAGSFTAR